MKKFSLMHLLKDIETMNTDPNPQREPEKTDLTFASESSGRGKAGRRPRRAKKAAGVPSQ